MNIRIAEIESYLSHGDFSLARRRLLDLVMDSGLKELIRKAISWSRDFPQHPEKHMDGHFAAGARAIMQQLHDTFAGTAEQDKMLLHADSISKRYPKGNFSLHALSLDVRSGEILGVVGENGNGKTTLLRCLSGQLALDSGSMEFPAFHAQDNYDIKHSVAFIPQRIPRWYGYLKDNLHFSASIAGVYGSDNELLVDFMLERLNLTSFAHLTWNQISSGYRTRFEIARVLLQRPKLLILDEPLANLDILAQQTMLSDLRYMAKSERHPMGVMLSSQQLHEVEKVADTVLFIRQGKLLFRTGDDVAETKAVIEVESSAPRDVLSGVFDQATVQIQYNGGFFTISSSQLSARELISTLTASDLPITYFRDITHSTKRFF